jgi:hypothetical protein
MWAADFETRNATGFNKACRTHASTQAETICRFLHTRPLSLAPGSAVYPRDYCLQLWQHAARNTRLYNHMDSRRCRTPTVGNGSWLQTLGASFWTPLRAWTLCEGRPFLSLLLTPEVRNASAASVNWLYYVQLHGTWHNGVNASNSCFRTQAVSVSTIPSFDAISTVQLPYEDVILPFTWDYKNFNDATSIVRADTYKFRKIHCNFMSNAHWVATDVIPHSTGCFTLTAHWSEFK